MVNISIGIQVPVTGVEFYPDIKHFHTHPKEESVQMLLKRTWKKLIPIVINQKKQITENETKNSH